MSFGVHKKKKNSKSKPCHHNAGQQQTAVDLWKENQP